MPQGHLLEQQSAPDVRAQLASMALGQQALPTGCGIVIAREKLHAARSTSQAKRLLNLRVGQTAQIGRKCLNFGHFRQNLEKICEFSCFFEVLQPQKIP